LAVWHAGTRVRDKPLQLAVFSVISTNWLDVGCWQILLQK